MPTVRVEAIIQYNNSKNVSNEKGWGILPGLLRKGPDPVPVPDREPERRPVAGIWRAGGGASIRFNRLLKSPGFYS